MCGGTSAVDKLDPFTEIIGYMPRYYRKVRTAEDERVGTEIFYLCEILCNRKRGYLAVLFYKAVFDKRYEQRASNLDHLG